MGVIFIDFRKAFDSISHTFLLQKLYGYGVRGIPLRWFKDFLTGHRQQVKIGSVTSQWLLTRQEISQGSLLGPILFLLCVNDLPDVLSTTAINMIADNTAVYIEGSSHEEVARSLTLAWFL